jgi:hypothetical protein
MRNPIEQRRVARAQRIAIDQDRVDGNSRRHRIVEQMPSIE